jgi:tetratricopeptide (TPR) repeat protein
MKLILAALFLLIATPARIEAQAPRSRRLNTQGYRLHKRGELARAKVKFEQALRADSANLLAGYNLGCTLCRLGQLKEAEAYLRFVLRGETGGKFARRMATDRPSSGRRPAVQPRRPCRRGAGARAPGTRASSYRCSPGSC